MVTSSYDSSPLLTRAGPTLKRVKPLLEAPINFKKSTVKQGPELGKKKKKSHKDPV
jgi:hypothetical protein